MRAAVLFETGDVGRAPLRLVEFAEPQAAEGEVLLRVRACGVCRTDIHIIEGELAGGRRPLIPGHQIAGEVIHAPPGLLATGTRVGVSWLGGTDGQCAYCRRGNENLCDQPTFTGYHRHGGYAEYATARADFVYPLPATLADHEAAPLLCAGVIGFRSLRVAGVEPGDRVGLFGFGASAHVVMPVLKAWNCEVYVCTRGIAHRKLALELGAGWVGDYQSRPPEPLDRAISFAPSGAVVIAALASLRKGGVVAINAIHLDGIPAFDYDSLLWGERQIRSVANMTRQDARDLLALAGELAVHPTVRTFPLAEANDAVRAVKQNQIAGAAVLVP